MKLSQFALNDGELVSIEQSVKGYLSRKRKR